MLGRYNAQEIEMEWKQHVIRCLYNQDASVQTAWQPFAHLILNMQHESKSTKHCAGT